MKASLLSLLNDLRAMGKHASTSEVGEAFDAHFQSLVIAADTFSGAAKLSVGLFQRKKNIPHNATRASAAAAKAQSNRLFCGIGIVSELLLEMARSSNCAKPRSCAAADIDAPEKVSAAITRDWKCASNASPISDFEACLPTALKSLISDRSDAFI